MTTIKIAFLAPTLASFTGCKAELGERLGYHSSDRNSQVGKGGLPPLVRNTLPQIVRSLVRV